MNRYITKSISISDANAILDYFSTYGEVTCALHHERDSYTGEPRMSVEYDFETSHRWVTVIFNSDYVSIFSRTLDNDSGKVITYRDYLLIIE